MALSGEASLPPGYLSSASGTNLPNSAAVIDEPEANAIAQAAVQLTNAVFETKDGDGDGTLTSSELGSGMSYVAQADVNGDEALSKDEVQSQLSAQFAVAAKEGIPTERVSEKWAEALLRSGTQAARAKSAYGSGTSPLANQLYDRLAANGFSRTPPTNLNRLVQGLAKGMGMNDTQQASLLRGLANRYPKGLGVSATA
jgi:hypothetical protein